MSSVALQLHSIREELSRDFESAMRRVVEIGYRAVEPAGFPGTNPERASRIFRELGLEVPSAHFALPLGDSKHQVLDAMHLLGAEYLVSGLGPEAFASVDQVRKTCDLFNEAAGIAMDHGFKFAVHNHWWEFGAVDGCPVYHLLLERLRPDVLFEIDTYWVLAAGLDPAAIVREFGRRAPLLHIKDGLGTPETPMTAVGEGTLNFPPIAETGRETVRWMIVELDWCATDMMTAVEKSYLYLAERIIRA
jgi:sugar phosphate isomerase/epimerase